MTKPVSVQVGSTRKAIMDLPLMKQRYEEEYPGYEPDTASLEQLKTMADGLKITVVLGTWCSDTRTQLPRFFKILDLAGVAEDTVTLICVDESKQSADGLTAALHIVSVPTFIFFNGDEEIGRIIELPAQTLEKDLVEILTNN